MNYCGIDLSKKSSHYCVVDAERRVVRQGKVSNAEQALRVAFAGLGRMRVALEASVHAFWMADVLTELGHDVCVVDPGRTKAIGSALIKHDKLDARVLAILCQADVLAVVDRPTQAERYGRMPVTVRDALVRSRTSLLNTARSLLLSEGVFVPSCGADAFTKVVRSMPDGLDTPLADAIEPLLVSIDELSRQIAACKAAIRAATRKNPIVRMLRSAPGVGPVVATQFLYTIRNPGRFESGRQVGAYLGLVPSLYSSGKAHRLGRITKRGSKRMRWLLTMAANALLRCKKPSALQAWGRRKVDELGRKKAIVAIARKLANVLWAMWKHERRFEPRLEPAT